MPWAEASGYDGVGVFPDRTACAISWLRERGSVLGSSVGVASVLAVDPRLLDSDCACGISNAGVDSTTVDARRDSLLRTAELTDDCRPVLTRDVRYNWKAASERNIGEVGSYKHIYIYIVKTG